MHRRINRAAACLSATAAALVPAPAAAESGPARTGAARTGPGDPAAAPVGQAAAFTVENPQKPGAAQVIAAYRYDPPCRAKTAVVLLHGFSSTKEAWDRPGYSVAQPLARGGYTVIAVDRPGYGASQLESGYDVSSEGYAAMTDQIIRQLKSSGFDKVALVGHSAGAEVAELTAGLYENTDGLVAAGYHHRPSDVLVQDFVTGDTPRALADDYEYFLGTPEHRSEMIFTDDADPAVVAADREAAVLTPSGEILTIGLQPSGKVLGRIQVPVYLQLGSADRLFEERFLGWDRQQFVQAPAVTVDIVPGAGHSHFLHRSGPAATARIVEWLRSHLETPPCS